ncbi:hypothetical protein ACFXTO_033096 [Malus domestica]
MQICLLIFHHGIFQLLSPWVDGPTYVTQCPIRPEQRYTYKFNITRQEGTLWWHAHISWLRAIVHGALIIHPKAGRSFPFPKPTKEVPILLGEWYNGNVVDIEEEGMSKGIAPNISNAYTINGLPGDLYDCSQNQSYQLSVVRGKTYLLRLINDGLNTQLFFKITNHKMTVVAIDAIYTTPYVSDMVVTGPGQTTDVLVKFNQPIGSYYMAATPYASASGAIDFDNSTTRSLSTRAPIHQPQLCPQCPTLTTSHWSINSSAILPASPVDPMGPSPTQGGRAHVRDNRRQLGDVSRKCHVSGSLQ